MKKVSLILSVVILSSLIFINCGGSPKEVTIGNQIWMAENLNVDKFRNGDPIPQAKTSEEWLAAAENGEPAWCFYDNDPANGAKYGKLYNWYAVTDFRGLAPKGWHIPTDSEWEELVDILGGDETAGDKLKSTSGWEAEGNGTNISRFSGLPGGLRRYDGNFGSIGGTGVWWSATDYAADYAWYRTLHYSLANVFRFSYSKGNGYSVRCVRD